MKRSSLAALAALVVVIVAGALAVPAVVGRHDGEPHPGITDRGRVPKGDAELVQAQRPATPPQPGHPVDLGQVAAAEQQFGFALLSKLGSDAGSGTNTTVSPASLAVALGMLRLGARGRTAREIGAALRTALPATDQAAAWHALTTAWAAAAKDGGLTLQTANSLWQQKGMTIPTPYLSALADYFDTGVWQTDFEHDTRGATDAINRWTAQQTHGRITKLFDDGALDNTTRLVLANAVYFNAAWQQPFDAAATRPDTFTLGNGTTTRAGFMHATMNLRSSSTPDYQAVELPYVGGRFAALAIMPTTRSLAAFTASMTSKRLGSVVSGLGAGEVELGLPKFETSSTLDLTKTLQALGMRKAFTLDADLTGIGEDLHVSQAIQRTYLKVAEKGTEAAAVTGIGVAGSSAVAQQITPITFDHPFLFLVSDTVTGALLFSSQIENPQT